MDGDTAAATSYWCRSHRYRFQAHQAGDCKKTKQQLLPTLPKMHLLSLHQIQTQPYSLFGPPWLSSSPRLLTHSGPLALLLLPFPMHSPSGHTRHCRVLLPAHSLPLHHSLIIAACSQRTQTMFYLGEQRKGQSTRGGLSAPPY